MPNTVQRMNYWIGGKWGRGPFPRLKIVPLAFWAFVVAISGPGQAATIHVDAGQTNQPPDGVTWATAYPDLAAGLAAASDGDEVWVAAGRYVPFGDYWSPSFGGSVSFEIPVGVSVYGGFAGTENARRERNPTVHRTVIAGIGESWRAEEYSPRRPLVAFAPDADAQTRLDGFRLEFNLANYGSAIHVRGGSPIIANNTIVSNRVDGPLGGSAIFVERSVELQPMDSLAMFRQVAGRLFSTDHRIGSDGQLITHTNILVWPTNDYDAAVHRVLQVAANVVDATTNRGDAYPHFPSVFRPYLRRESVAGRTNVYVAGYQLQDEIEPTITSAEEFVRKSNYWDLRNPAVIVAIPEQPDLTAVQPLALGVPLVLGAKKGLPNFNELAVETSVYLERRLQLRRLTPTSLPYQTNEFYVVGVSNVFAVEAWNSYQAAYPRPLTLAVEVDFDMAMLSTNSPSGVLQTWPPIVGPGSRPVATSFAASSIIPASNWVGRQFHVPLLTNHLFLSNSVWWADGQPRFTPAPSNSFTLVSPAPNQFFIPDWILTITNRVRYVVLDGGRIVDYANLAPMIWSTNLIDAMTISGGVGQGSFGDQIWDMRRLNDTDQLSDLTIGVWNQLLVSLGFTTVSETIWRSYGARNPSSQDRALAIDAFRRFALGLPGNNFPGRYPPISPNGLIAEAPFAPARRLELKRTFEVGDPLVHATVADVSPPPGANDPWVLPGGISAPPVQRLTGIDRINKRYTPWLSSEDERTSNEAYRDPLVTHSDRWQFASERVLNHDWFDRIHRGTPWQTIYYGGGQAMIQLPWNDYTHPLMLPQNDWRWIEEFRKDWLGLPVVESPAPTPIIVNNTVASNTAGYGMVGAAIHLEPGTSVQIVNNIVAFNAAGIEQLPEGVPFVLANCVFGNANGDYLGLTPGLRDLQLDPVFRRSAAGDFNLSTTSPLIDAAHPLPWLAGWVDASEPARRQNAHFDLGAAELAVDTAELRLSVVPGQPVLRLDLFGFPGRRFRLEQSTDFENWMPLQEWVTAGGVVVTDWEPTAEMQFLRAVSLETHRIDPAQGSWLPPCAWLCCPSLILPAREQARISPSETPW